MSVHSLALQLLGQFARVQDVIDGGLAPKYFEKRTPATAEFVLEKVVSRIRDADRPKLFLGIAKDLDTDAVLDDFASTFSRVKALRDAIAHSGELYETSIDTIEVGQSYVRAPESKEKSIETVDRAKLIEALHASGWLFAQVLYVMYAGGLLTNMTMGDVPIRVVKPPRLSKNWDGVPLVPEE